MNARHEDPAAAVKKHTGGGARGVLVTAVSPKAFEQALGVVGRGGTVALNGLPPGDFRIAHHRARRGRGRHLAPGVKRAFLVAPDGIAHQNAQGRRDGHRDQKADESG